MRKYEQLASDIIKNVGGKDNVAGLKHCITRLRFTLKDESKANDDILRNTEGVISIVKSIGQYMVVIGEHVTEVYDEVMLQLGFSEEKAVVASEKKKSILDKALGFISSGLGPALNLLCACGMIKGLTTVLTMLGLPSDSGIYMMLNAAGDCIFYSLPLLLGFNVAKKQNIDPYFGFLLGAALTYPAIQGVDINLFGFVVNASYTSSFLPIIFGLIFAIPVYKFFDKHLHPLVKGFFTPMLTLLIAFPLTFFVIGPVANLVAAGINTAINAVFTISPVLGGLVVGGLWQILVMFGVHGTLVMFAFYDLISGNPSLLVGITAVICYAVCGTLIAVAVKSKNKELKSQSISTLVSALFGVTEPAMYGIIVPRKQMLLSTCVGGASAGLIAGLFGMKMYTYAGMGVFSLFGFFNPAGPTNMIGLAALVVVPIVVAALCGMALFKDETAETPKQKDHKVKPLIVKSPVDGKVLRLNECSDSVFASETMGKGCVVIPDNGEVYAPVAGTVTTLFPTKHAIGITSDEGLEVLIHIGINTVNLEGKHFAPSIAQGERVKEGDFLLKFDKEMIEKEGFSTEIPIVITNTSDYLDVIEMDFGKHIHGDDILAVVRKENK